jgi:hypothetical protein
MAGIAVVEIVDEGVDQRAKDEPLCTLQWTLVMRTLLVVLYSYLMFLRLLAVAYITANVI